MKILKNILFLGVIFMSMTACEPERPKCPGGPGCEPTESSHTIVMYVIANNNLSYLLRKNVDMAMTAVRNGLPENSRVLVYWDGFSKTSLTELVMENGQVVEKTLKNYEDQNSTDPEVMKSVLQDVKYFAAAETYGIALLSHATGWFPPELNGNIASPYGAGSHTVEHNLVKPEGALTRSFGSDGAYLMSIPDLAEGLSPIHFNYIVFDVCFMASVEALYDLRDNADYIIASPVEVMGAGMPYNKILPVLFNRLYTLPQRLISTVETVVYHYNTAETYKSSSLTLIETNRLKPLALAAREVYRSGLGEVDLSGVQALESMSPDHAFFDMKDYLRQAVVGVGAGDEAADAYANFEEALSKVILYEKHTPTIYSVYGGFFNADRISGISTYVPRDQFPVTKAAYLNTDWAKFIYGE